MPVVEAQRPLAGQGVSRQYTWYGSLLIETLLSISLFVKDTWAPSVSMGLSQAYLGIARSLYAPQAISTAVTAYKDP